MYVEVGMPVDYLSGYILNLELHNCCQYEKKAHSNGKSFHNVLLFLLVLLYAHVHQLLNFFVQV